VPSMTDDEPQPPIGSNPSPSNAERVTANETQPQPPIVEPETANANADAVSVTTNETQPPIVEQEITTNPTSPIDVDQRRDADSQIVTTLQNLVIAVQTMQSSVQGFGALLEATRSDVQNQHTETTTRIQGLVTAVDRLRSVVEEARDIGLETNTRVQGLVTAVDNLRSVVTIQQIIEFLQEVRPGDARAGGVGAAAM
jgi:hypothetical protein